MTTAYKTITHVQRVRLMNVKSAFIAIAKEFVKCSATRSHQLSKRRRKILRDNKSLIFTMLKERELIRTRTAITSAEVKKHKRIERITQARMAKAIADQGKGTSAKSMIDRFVSSLPKR